MRRSVATCAGFLMALAVSAGAQEGTWSVSASAGIALLEFDEVDADGQRDIAAYRAAGIAIADYPSLACAPVVEATVEYRFERDVAIAPFLVYQQARTSTAFRDSLHALSLERRLTAVLAGVQMAYVLPPLRGGSELSVVVGVGNLWATADQTTFETLTVKTGPTTEPRVEQDADATASQHKLVVRAGMQARVPFWSAVSFVARALYLYAPLGTMAGTIREFDLHRPIETTVSMNYSALQVQLGVHVAL